MALDNIKKSILDDAQAQITTLDSETKQRIDEINAVWSKKINSRKSEIIASAQKKTDQKVMQMEFKLQAQSQAKVLEAKQQLIDTVYKTAYKQLSDLNDNDYVKLLSNLIKELPGDAGILISVENKESQLKKALKESGKKFDVSKETVRGSGGFVFKSDDIEINQTFQTLINQAKDSTLTEIARILFSNKEEIE